MAHKIFDPATQEARIFHEADCDLKRLKGKISEIQRIENSDALHVVIEISAHIII